MKKRANTMDEQTCYAANAHVCRVLVDATALPWWYLLKMGCTLSYLIIQAPVAELGLRMAGSFCCSLSIFRP
jgi:hypothetical protein